MAGAFELATYDLRLSLTIRAWKAGPFLPSAARRARASLRPVLRALRAPLSHLQNALSLSPLLSRALRDRWI